MTDEHKTRVSQRGGHTMKGTIGTEEKRVDLYGKLGEESLEQFLVGDFDVYAGTLHLEGEHGDFEITGDGEGIKIEYREHDDE